MCLRGQGWGAWDDISIVIGIRGAGAREADVLVKIGRIERFLRVNGVVFEGLVGLVVPVTVFVRKIKG